MDYELTNDDDFIEGTDGADVVSTPSWRAAGHDIVNTRRGDDTISAMSLSAQIDGGGGNDAIDVVIQGKSSVVSNIRGGSGADWIGLATDGSSVNLFGNDGNDVFEIWEDSVFSGSSLNGGNGYDTLVVPGDVHDQKYARLDALTIESVESLSVMNVAYASTTFLNQFTTVSGAIMLTTSDLLSGFDMTGGSVTIKASYANVDLSGSTGNIEINSASYSLWDTHYVMVGSDRLTGGSGDDFIRSGLNRDFLNGGAGDDRLNGGAGEDRLDGGSGNDTAVYDTSVTVDLLQPSLNTGAARGDVYVSIENLAGGTGNYHFSGDAGNNRLDGGFGADILVGRGGDDILLGGGDNSRLSGDDGNDLLIAKGSGGAFDGGSGVDTLDLHGLGSGLAVSLAAAATLNGAFIGGIVRSVENLIGTKGNDALTGTAAENRLDGAAGDDILTGGAGRDLLEGGDGFDTASYATASSKVRVDLDNSRQNSAGDATGDNLKSIEAIIGSSFADSLRGDGLANTLTGGDGDDSLNGRSGDDLLVGGRGADYLTGGDGIDTISYAGAASKIRTDLVDGRKNNLGDAAGDVLLGIENIIGSDHNDSLRGDDGANRIEGGTGNDALNGRGGNDALLGGEGDDSLLGGAGNDLLVGGAGSDRFGGGSGADIFRISANAGTDTILDFEQGLDRFDLTGVVRSFFALYIEAADIDGDGVADDVLVDMGSRNFHVLNTAVVAIGSSDFIF